MRRQLLWNFHIIGQANIWVVFYISGGKELEVLVARQEAEEILIDLNTLMDLSIIPKDFPLPQDYTSLSISNFALL